MSTSLLQHVRFLHMRMALPPGQLSCAASTCPYRYHVISVHIYQVLKPLLCLQVVRNNASLDVSNAKPKSKKKKSCAFSKPTPTHAAARNAMQQDFASLQDFEPRRYCAMTHETAAPTEYNEAK